MIKDIIIFILTLSIGYVLGFLNASYLDILQVVLVFIITIIIYEYFKTNESNN